MKKNIILIFFIVFAIMCTATGCTNYSDLQPMVFSGSSDQKISEGGTYVLSGNLSDAKLVIDTKQKVYLQLDGVSINNARGPAIQVVNAKKLTVTVNEGTKNEITDGGKSKAALSSDCKIIFEGKGELRINGNKEHGIQSKEGITINDADLIINAIKDGIKAKESIIINEGNINIEEAVEGMESKNKILIKGGSLTVNARDDGISAENDITIAGGEVYLSALKGDAIDSNGTIHISGGNTIAIGSQMPEASIDCNENDFIIKGGTITGAAGSTSTPTAELSTQISVILKGANEGEVISISSESGEIMTFTSPRTFDTLIFSSPEIVEGETLTVKVEGKEREKVTVRSMVIKQGENSEKSNQAR